MQITSKIRKASGVEYTLPVLRAVELEGCAYPQYQGPSLLGENEASHGAVHGISEPLLTGASEMRGAKDGVRLKIMPAMMKCSVARKWRWSMVVASALANAARGQLLRSISDAAEQLL